MDTMEKYGSQIFVLTVLSIMGMITYIGLVINVVR